MRRHLAPRRVHRNITPTAPVRLLVGMGLASRCHAWKVHVSPACATTSEPAPRCTRAARTAVECAIDDGGVAFIAAYSDGHLLQVKSVDVLNEASGTFAFGTSPDSMDHGGGIPCVGGAVKRTGAVFSGGTNSAPGIDCGDLLSCALTLALMTRNGWLAGPTVCVQFISRDGGGRSATACRFSCGLRFTTAP